MSARYISGEANHCPGCNRSQWIVGRSTAECVFCATALPLSREHQREPRLLTFGSGGGKISRMAVTA